MMVPLAARSVIAVAGALLVLTAWGSVIGTLIVPRPAGGWLTRWVDRIINGAFLAALQGLLEQLLNRRDFDPAFDHEEAAEELARGWFANQRAKSQVATLLRKFGLDEGAIEAEAIRSRAEDLERLDRMLALAELRRSKALHCLADYRQSQADRKKLSTDQILENDEVPRLVAVGKRPD